MFVMNIISPQVHINGSALLYIPVEIFEKAYIKELYLNNSAFNKVFDESLEWVNLKNGFKHPYKVQIENSKLMRYVVFYYLTQIKCAKFLKHF